MHKIKLITFVIPFLIVISACQKETKTSIDMFFYTYNNSYYDTKSYYLTVDGNKIGAIPVIHLKASKIHVNDTSFENNALKLKILSGEHVAKVFTDDNIEVANTTFYIKHYKNKIKTGGGSNLNGGSSINYFDTEKKAYIWIGNDTIFD